jgi:hypothetical protein
MRSRPSSFLSRIAILAATAAILVSGFAPPGTQAQASADVHTPHGPSTAPLKITFGDQSSEWTAATLAALPHATVSVFNEHAKAQQSYSGVPLTVLLTKLGVPEKPHGKEFRLYLVAEGSDGYQVVYSVGEVTPDVHDGTTLVADSVDGKPLGDNGLFQLVTTGEKRPARWVRNLVAIRVMTAQ